MDEGQARDAQGECRRIKDGDALAYLRDDLAWVARDVAGQREGFAGWFSASVDLLACVPDVDQRMSWAYRLVVALPPIGAQPPEVLRELLRLAEEVRRARVGVRGGGHA